MRHGAVLAMSSVIGLAVAGLVATPAHAATFNATDGASLITAINDANANPGPDTITLTGPLITLLADLPLITDTLAIEGPGSDLLTIDADGWGAFVSVGSATNTAFALSGVTIEFADLAGVDADGTAFDLDVDVTDVVVGASGTDGIHIDASGGSLVTVTDVVSTGNGVEGLEISLAGNASLTLSNSEFSNNSSDGIVVETFNTSVAVIDGLTADINGADGIDVDADDDSSVTIRTTSASLNGDNGFESANNGGTAVYENVTAEGNDEDGFDIEVDVDGAATLTNPTAIDNGANGVLVEPDTPDAMVTVTGGLAEGNGAHGLFLNVDEGTATSTGFVARGNDEGGVLIDGFNGQATLRNATVTDNNDASLSAGGGVDIEAYDDGTGPLDVLIEGTTISSNESSLFGGGISGTVDDGSTVTLRNSTISGNEAPNAGAITLESTDDSQLTIEHSTITENETTNENQEAVFPVGMQVTITHSIIAGNIGPGDDRDLGEDTSTIDIDYSLVQTADANALAALTAGMGNIVGEAAGLGPLADNGGPTLTHLPLTGSPAISGGDAAIVGAPATDQRGEDRIVGVIEIGAVELEAPELAATGSSESAAALAAGLALLLVLGGSLLMVARRRHAVTRPH